LATPHGFPTFNDMTSLHRRSRSKLLAVALTSALSLAGLNTITATPAAATPSASPVFAAKLVGCSGALIVIDTDPKGAKVRAKASKSAKIKRKLYAGDIVVITGIQGDWVKISAQRIIEDDGAGYRDEKITGWMYWSLLGAYVAEGTPVYNSPDSPDSLGTTTEENVYPFVDCEGTWRLVNADGYPWWYDNGE
jgi:Bacterial SH3 domain